MLRKGQAESTMLTMVVAREIVMPSGMTHPKINMVGVHIKTPTAGAKAKASTARARARMAKVKAPVIVSPVHPCGVELDM
jgi:hypothetical protein